MRKQVLVGACVLMATAAYAGKSWEYMGADERLAWASRQVPRLCGSAGVTLKEGESTGLMRAGIMLVSQETVRHAIRARCAEKRASR